MALHPDLVLRGKMSTILPESQQLSLLTCRVCLDECADARLVPLTTQGRGRHHEQVPTRLLPPLRAGAGRDD